MKTTRWILPAGPLGVLALTGLAPPAAAAPPSGTATPLQAVATLLRPFHSGVAGNTLACNGITGQVQACPITARLRYRLQHYVRYVETGNLLSRSQNPPRAVSWTQTDANAFVAHVTTRWIYHPSYTIVVVVARQDDGWRVDDAYCAGRPQTSLYNPPTEPCV